MAETDPFRWLEDVDSDKALGWVREQNARTLALLEADPRYQALYDSALKIITAGDRIPYPSFFGRELANFWQDSSHVRGVWRKTTLASYRTAEPAWQTILDIDALAAAEGRNWVYHGAHALPPDDRLALVGLSDGGKDASETREFDTVAGRFVDNGFFLSEGKQSAAWVDADTLLVGRDWGPGTLTASGYPYIVKRWRRGTPLATAEEVFRGIADDVNVRPVVLRDPDGTVRGTLVFRALTFFESETWLLGPAAPVRLPIPLKSQLRGFVSGQVLFTLDGAWAWRGTTYPAGALISFDLDAARAAPDAIDPQIVYSPAPRETVEHVATTRSRLLVTVYRNVQGRAISYRFAEGRWQATPLPLPDNASVSLVSTSDTAEQAFLDVASYLLPNTLYLADLAAGTAEPVKAMPARFDASGAAVEQFDATSADGTRIPYFVV
ncbi:MAG: S9 family peptidase, partial [Alphaproteobacteria bacterium]|nr:S9 family peptidase [Alphaproteobacteria bacterium]